MRNHPFWARLLSLTLGLLLLFSCVGAAFAADPPGNSLEGLTEPDSPWDHFPDTSGLDTNKLQTYTPSGNWAFAQAPTGTTSFAELTDLYYIPNYDTWAVSAGIEAAGGPGAIRWVGAHFHNDRRIHLSGGYMPTMIYTAPETGTIRISATDPIWVDWWKQGPNGVRIAVYKSNQHGAVIPVWPVGERWQLLGGSEGAPGTPGNEYVFEPFDLCIQKGEKLYFVLESNGNEGDDVAKWNPSVSYLNDEYDAANDPALAMPETSVMADVFPYDSAQDNNYTHGNGWQMNAARGNTYTAMNHLSHNDAWTQARYFESDGDVEEGVVLWERGVIKSDYNTADGNWNNDAMHMFPAADGNDVAFTYKAPRDGVLKLSFGDASLAQDAAGNKIGLAVYKNNVQIWPEMGVYTVQSDEGGWAEKALGLEAVVSAVHAGDLLHIRASLIESVGEYALKVMPEAEYTSLEYDESLDKEAEFNKAAKYSYTDQFSGTQGQDCWWYLYAPIGENTVMQVPYYQDGCWYDGTWNYLIATIFENAVTPGSEYDAIIAFKAPYTGTVTTYLQGGVWVKEDDGSGDGVRVWQQLSSDGDVRDITEVTEIANGGASDFEPVTIDIRKNEYIYFRVNRGAENNWFDETYLNPGVQYTSIDFDDPGIEEGPAAERKEPSVSHNLEEGIFPMTGRDFADAQTYSLTAAELTARIQAGDLEEGAVYEVTDHLSLFFNGIKEETVYDLRNICIRTSPSGYSYSGTNPDAEGRYAIFLANNEAPVTLRNFTLEVSAWDGSDKTPEEAVNTWNCAGLTLEKVEIKGKADYAVHSVNSKMDAQTSLISCRIEGAFGESAVAFHDNSEGNAAATPSVTGSCIINTDVDGSAMYDINSSGAFLMNNALSAEGTTVRLGCSDAVVQNNSIEGDISLASEGILLNTLIALNEADIMRADGSARNTVVLMNSLESIELDGGNGVTLAQNSVSGNMSAQKVDYLLMQDNTVGGEISTAGSTNAYGDDLFDPSARAEAGVNEDLLPKPNKEVFAGMDYKTDVRTENDVKKLKSYLNAAARNQTYAIIPPGLYSTEAISLAGVENFDLYAYGVAVEFDSAEWTVFSMNGCKDVSVYGLSITHKTHANGQGTVIEKGDDYVIVQSDPGYFPDLTDSDNIETTSPFIEAFRPGETVPYADIGFKSMEYLGGGKHKCVFGTDRSQELEVGGKITMRGKGSGNVVVMNGCENLRFEDFNILSGVFFAFNERSGYGNTQLYRVAITPKAAPVLSGSAEDYAGYSEGLVWTDEFGRLRGPESLLATADAIHSTNMRVGPQAVSCIFERLTDDGANISGEFGKVLSFDPETKVLAYTDGDNYYPGLPTPFEEGDKAVLFTREGKLIGEATVTAKEQLSGGAHQITLDTDVTLEPGTLIENASANCAGVTFDNCLMDTTRSRGLLIKAPDATVTHCTIRNVGMAAILIKPETKDGWNECGYSQNITITNNLLENTGFYASSRDIYSPISIDSDGAAYSDPAYLMHRDALIENNVIRNRHSLYAVYLHGVQNAQILNNDFGVRKGLTTGDDKQSPVLINGAYNVEVSDNIYPTKASPKVELSVETRKIFGSDIEQPPIKDYVDLEVASIYTTDGWQVELTLRNLTEDRQICELRFADTTAFGLFAPGTEIPKVTLKPGETRKLYFPVETMPSEMTPPMTSVGVDISAVLPGITDGVFTSDVDFNGAVQVEIPSVDDIQWNDITGIRKQITTKGELIDAEARFAWDDNNLYLRVAVLDDVHYNCENRDELWDWDSLQIGLAPNRSNNDLYFVYSIGLLSDGILNLVDNDTIGGKSGALTQEQMPSTITRDEAGKTTTYLMTIPWSLLGLDGAPASGDVGVEIVVHDRDASLSDLNEPGRWESYYMEFFGGVAVGSRNRDPSLFGRILLLDEPFVVPDADTGDLLAALDEAEKVDRSKYTETSLEKLDEAVRAAKELLDSDLTVNDQDAVNAAAEAVRLAISALVTHEKAALDALYNTNKDKVQGNYTDDSWKVFTDALAAAKAVLENSSATATDIAKALQGLQDAIDGLTEKAETSSEPEEPSQPGASSGPASSDSSEGPGTGSNHSPLLFTLVLLLVCSGCALALLKKRIKI